MTDDETRQIWYGVKDDHSEIIFAEETEKQLEELLKMDIDVFYGDTRVNWGDIACPEEKRSLLYAVIEDRRVRKCNFMADRPPFAILTIKGNTVIRVEFYEGHDVLTITYDFKSKSHKFPIGISYNVFLEY